MSASDPGSDALSESEVALSERLESFFMIIINPGLLVYDMLKHNNERRSLLRAKDKHCKAFMRTLVENIIRDELVDLRRVIGRMQTECSFGPAFSHSRSR